MPQRAGPRSMTFNACWTCKRRKVKCDERPGSCGNCARLKLECGGYGVRLQWIKNSPSHATDSKVGVARGRIRVERPWSSHYTSDKVDTFLVNIDEDVARHSLHSRHGPFAVFQSQPRIGAADDTSAWDLSEQKAMTVSANKSSMASFNKTPFDGSKPSFMAIALNSSSIRGTDRANAGTLLRHQIPVMPRNSIEEVEVQHLMHHYIIHIAGLLIPVEHPMNPYRNLYVPTALAAASAGQSQPGHLSDESTLYSVLLYSLLASSAYHLWNCLPDQVRYHMLGSRYRQKALSLLQSAITQSKSEADYPTILMAMLSLVSVDVMSACEADFAIHLQGTRQLLRLLPQTDLANRVTRQLNEISDFLSLLVRSVSPIKSIGQCSVPSPLEIESTSSMGQADSCVSYMYGVTPQIATAIQETCQIADRLASYESRQESIPSDVVNWSIDLGRALLSWSLEREPLHLSEADSAEMREIFCHHANAWHQAALIYYNRRVKKDGGENILFCVEAVARNMHAVEDIKSRATPGSNYTMAPITWPAFVASCEAVEREPWRLWWERVQNYKIANIKAQWEVVQLVWQKRDGLDAADSARFDWTQVIQSMDLSLLPI